MSIGFEGKPGFRAFYFFVLALLWHLVNSNALSLLNLWRESPYFPCSSKTKGN